MAAILAYQQPESKHKTGQIKVKKMLSVTLAGCMAASALMMSAGAANIPNAKDMSVKQLAYMDIVHVPTALKDDILSAREKIIYGNQAWAVDGALSIIRKDGSVEELPEFTDLYPGWEIPEHKPAIVTSDAASYSGRSTIGYTGNVYLTRASSTVNSKSFCSFTGDGRRVGTYAIMLPGTSYNLGFYDEDSYRDKGWIPSLSKGEGGKITSQEGVRYSVHASVPSTSAIGYARMKVVTPASDGNINFWDVEDR